MKLLKTFIGLPLLTGLGYASSLAVYQDASFYTFEPQSNYIGFTERVKATCDGKTSALQTGLDCPKEERLCKDANKIKETSKKLMSVRSTLSVLQTFVKLPQPQTLNAEEWIASAKKIGEEEAELNTLQDKLNELLVLQRTRLKKQAPSEKPLYLENACKGALELALPYGQIGFSTSYEAQFEKDTIRVTQYLSVTNRSGIEIEADEAMFYYRAAHRYISPVHFTPWIVSKYVPRPKRMYSKKATRSMMQADEAMAGMPVAMAEVNAPVPAAEYLSAREYRIRDLSLPSTGEAVNVEVTSWNAPMHCGLEVYPYRSSAVFEVCVFKPKTQIENNSWKIKEDGRIVNDQAVGEYDKDTYRLYTRTDEDIKAVRKPLVKKERTTGIFGSTVRKKDGFTLLFINKSEKKKALSVTERIPVSTTKEIKVKLLDVRSEKKVKYALGKEGELVMHVSLAPHETKSVDVVFEISYDKDLKINY